MPEELEHQGQRDKAGAGSATACSRWRTSGARSSSSGSLTGRCTWHSASSRTCAKTRQRRQHQGQAHEAPGQRARGRRQGGPAARPGHPVQTGVLHCCSRASPSTSSPTFNCPLPRLRRPPADLNTATEGPRTPTGGGPYDRSLGVGVPPDSDSPPKPVSFGFCFSGNTGFFFFFFLYIAVNSNFFLNFLNDGRSMADSRATSRVTLSTGINRRGAVASGDVAASGGPTGRTPSMCCREVARRL